MGLANDIKALVDTRTWGYRVFRPATVPGAPGTHPIFIVTNGYIRLTSLTGVVVTAMDGLNAATLQIQNLPVGGGVQNMSIAGGAITSYIAGTIFSLTGVVGAAMDENDAGHECLPDSMATRLIVPAGTINLTVAAATQTGTIQWTLYYVPLDAGARVTAV